MITVVHSADVAVSRTVHLPGEVAVVMRPRTAAGGPAAVRGHRPDLGSLQALALAAAAAVVASGLLWLAL